MTAALLIVLALIWLLSAADAGRQPYRVRGFIPSPTRAELRRKRFGKAVNIALFLAALWIWALWMQGSL